MKTANYYSAHYRALAKKAIQRADRYQAKGWREAEATAREHALKYSALADHADEQFESLKKSAGV